MTQTQATFSIVKGVAGAGIFALPFAFLQAGLVGGVLGVTLLAFLSASSIKLLVRVKRRVFGSHAVTYLDVAERVLGEEAGKLVTVAVVACSLGVSTAYLDFIRCMGRSLLPSVAAVVTVHGVFLLPVLPIVIALCLLQLVPPALLHCSHRRRQHRAGRSLRRRVRRSRALRIHHCRLSPHPLSTGRCHGVRPAGEACHLPVSSSPRPPSSSLIHFFILPVESNMARARACSPPQWTALSSSPLPANTAFGVLGLLCFPSPASIVLDNVRGGAVVSVVKLLLCVDLHLQLRRRLLPSARDSGERSAGQGQPALLASRRWT